MNAEKADAVVQQIAGDLMAQFPDLPAVVMGSDRLQEALGDFRDGAVAGLVIGQDPTTLERALRVLKTHALAAAPDKVYTLERVFEQAIKSVVLVARGEVKAP